MHKNSLAVLALLALGLALTPVTAPAQSSVPPALLQASPAPRLTPGYPTPTVASNINNAPAWQPRHAYSAGSTVVAGASPLRGYRAVTPGTSGTSAPVGTGASITDGTVTWKYISDVDFRSIDDWIESIPKVSSAGLSGCVRPYYIMMRAGYVGLLWNGGEYLYTNGAGILFKDHTDARLGCGEGDPKNLDDPSRNFAPTITLKAAPGESFRDRGSNVPLVYNPANGVAIRAAAQPRGQNSFGSVISIGDYLVTIDGLQVKSDIGNGIFDVTGYGVIKNCLIDAADLGLATDYMGVVSNDVIIARGSTGISAEYNNLFDHVTLINPNKTGIVGVAINNPGFVGGATLRNSAIFGFRYAATRLQAWATFSTQSDNNAADLSRSTQSGATIPNSRGPATIDVLPGAHSLFDVPFSSATFLDPAGDYRLAAGSPLIGAGALGPENTFTADSSTTVPLFLTKHGPFSPPMQPHVACCGMIPVYAGMRLSGPGVPSGTTIVEISGQYDVNPIVPSMPVIATQSGGSYTADWGPIDGLDIVGTPRGARPDIGAWQYSGRH